MAIYVYNQLTGALVSYCPSDTDPVADAAALQANGLVAISGQPALDTTHNWNAATRTVAVVAAPVVPQFIPSWDFVNCFTSPEVAAIKGSTDTKVIRFMLMLSVTQQVDLSSATIQQGVNYLASISLITPARVPQILAGQVQAA